MSLRKQKDQLMNYGFLPRLSLWRWNKEEQLVNYCLSPYIIMCMWLR